MAENNNISNYTDDNIRTLEGLEHVRLRPGMYIGKLGNGEASDDGIYTRQIGSAEHDYTQMEWFQNGLAIDSCWWCEPYLDDSGSQTWVGILCIPSGQPFY